MHLREIGLLIVLFWPLTILLICVFFFLVLGAAVFFGSLFCGFLLFLYGIYAFCRDIGLLSWSRQTTLEFVSKWSSRLSGHIGQSFLFSEKEGAVPRDKPCLFVCHPHGVAGFAWFFHFVTNLTNWPQDVPRPRVAIHSLFFRIPVIREMVEYLGAISADEKDILQALRSGTSVALLVGGVEEIFHSTAGKFQILLKKRRGYIRIAQQTGVPLVPLVTLEENGHFPIWRGPWFDCFQLWLKKRLGVFVPLPSLTALRNWAKLLSGPLEPGVQTFALPALEGNAINREEYIARVEAFGKQTGAFEVI